MIEKGCACFDTTHTVFAHFQGDPLRWAHRQYPDERCKTRFGTREAWAATKGRVDVAAPAGMDWCGVRVLGHRWRFVARDSFVGVAHQEIIPGEWISLVRVVRGCWLFVQYGVEEQMSRGRECARRLKREVLANAPFGM